MGRSRDNRSQRKIVKIAVENGKCAGTTSSVADFQNLVDMGYKFITVGADVVGLWSYYHDIISKIKDVKPTSTDSIYKG